MTLSGLWDVQWLETNNATELLAKWPKATLTKLCHYQNSFSHESLPNGVLIVDVLSPALPKHDLEADQECMVAKFCEGEVRIAVCSVDLWKLGGGSGWGHGIECSTSYGQQCSCKGLTRWCLSLQKVRIISHFAGSAMMGCSPSSAARSAPDGRAGTAVVVQGSKSARPAEADWILLDHEISA